MNRRNLLKIGFVYAASAIGLTSLGGCGGSDSSVANDGQSGSCLQGPFSLGLNFATSAMLEEIISVSSLAYAGIGVSNGLPSTSFPTPAYFNLVDPDNMSAYGLNADKVPLPTGHGQGSLGSCVAWGVGYAMCSFMNALSRSVSAQTPSRQVSPADLYYKVLRSEPGNVCGNGTYVKYAMDVLVREGVASLEILPYSDNACSFPSIVSQFFIDGYSTLAPTDAAEIKRAVSNFLVLPFGMKVYSDFMSHSGAGVYSHSVTDTSCHIGGHCMSIVGFDDRRRAYRVINSWGTAWGDNGFVWIEYDTFHRIVSEVYAPYVHSSRSVNTLIPTQSSQSGAVSTESARSRTFLNIASSHFDKVWFNFKLNDAVRVDSYRLYYYPDGQSSGYDLGGRMISQYLRGSLIEVGLSDDSFLHRFPNGAFVLNLTGKLMDGEPMRLDMFTSYPGPNPR